MTPPITILFDLLGDLAGLCHDLGKATVMCQRKFREPDFPASDPIRHEWISLKLLDAVIEGKTLAEAFESLTLKHLHEAPFARKQGLKSVTDVLRFCVVTHHGLLSPSNARQHEAYGSDRTLNHVRTMKDHPYTQAQQKYLQLQAPFEGALQDTIRRRLAELGQLTQTFDPNTWRAVAIYVRACLIMADHTVSARALHQHECLLAANTIRSGQGKQRTLNQDLNYHLREVGTLARTFALKITNTDWQGVSENTHHKLLNNANDQGRFTWQGIAAKKLADARRNTNFPALVLNVAGTGTGKTRMNVRASAVLSKRPQLRVTSVLNLRTLTLQTGNAYRTELGLANDELACVIGDRTVKALYDRSIPNTDENPEELEFESSATAGDTPEYLREYLDLHPRQAGLITVPVLVSTVDFVIAAGEPQRQGHHAAALLRIMNSDLIIDEADDYDPDAFVALLRIVEMAVLFGNNVIVSSATLPRPMIDSLVRIYLSACERYQQLKLQPGGTSIVAVIDNYLEPAIFWGDACRDVPSAYVKRLQGAMATQANDRVRVPFLAKLKTIDEAGFMGAIADSIAALHEHHRWRHEATGKDVSVGLVRIANISTAIRVARFLSSAFPEAYIATYHARDFLIQRHRKEMVLDELLTRKKGNVALNQSPYIAHLVNAIPATSVKLIVVATPVEEVGRDHDFDWAVIEPSSARSLVQASGRVNRHRLWPVDAPNIHLLQYNYRHCVGQPFAFQRPGYEIKKAWEHDLEKLLDWSTLGEVNASLRLGDHPFSILEDEVITEHLRTPSDILIGNGFPQEWMTEFFYTKYPLRKRVRTEHWTFSDGKFYQWLLGPLALEKQDFDKAVERRSPVSNAWLTWETEELVEFAKARHIPIEKAFEIKIANYRGETLRITWDMSFGMWVQ